MPTVFASAAVTSKPLIVSYSWMSRIRITCSVHSLNNSSNAWDAWGLRLFRRVSTFLFFTFNRFCLVLHKNLRKVDSRQACKYDFLGKPFCFVVIKRCFQQNLPLGLV